MSLSDDIAHTEALAQEHAVSTRSQVVIEMQLARAEEKILRVIQGRSSWTHPELKFAFGLEER